MSPKKQQRKQYSATFKDRAVKLSQQSDSSVSQVARELGVAEKLGWVRRAWYVGQTVPRHASR